MTWGAADRATRVLGSAAWRANGRHGVYLTIRCGRLRAGHAGRTSACDQVLRPARAADAGVCGRDVRHGGRTLRAGGWLRRGDKAPRLTSGGSGAARTTG